MTQVLNTASGQSATINAGTGLCPSGASAEITLMGWAKANSYVAAYHHFGGQGDLVNSSNCRGYWFYILAVDATTFYIGCYFMNNALSVPQLLVNIDGLNWHHYAVTYSAANNRATFYVDFVQVGAVQIVTVDVAASTGLYSFGGATGGFTGTTTFRHQDCRMYNIELTSAQITDIGNNPCAAPITGIVSQWLFDGDALDAIGSNDITLNSATYVTDSAITCGVTPSKLAMMGVGV